MTTARHRQHIEAAFTLVELLTAVAILSVLMIFIGLILTATTRATKLSRQRLDADSQARLIFDSMADDFNRMLRRPDVDFHFVKGSTATTPGVNDCFFMFCEDPGYFASALTSTSESNVSLVGYRIYSNTTTPIYNTTTHIYDTPYTLEKLAKGLAWDLQSATATYSVPYLTLDQVSAATPTYAPDAASTIVGRFKDSSGNAIDQPAYADTNFHLLGDSTFRLEYCFLLTDGSYSIVPALNYSFTPPSGTAVTSNLNATRAPTPSDGFPTYGIGSRWYDNIDATSTANNYRGYICTSAPQVTGSTGAVWQPLGMADVQAVVVAIAILDQSSQKIINYNATTLANMAAALPNPVTNATTGALTATPTTLMATTWLNTVNSPTFVSGVPTVVTSQVRIYQRFFYLNNLYNNL